MDFDEEQLGKALNGVGGRIRKKREARGLTQTELAHRSGVSNRRISAIETKGGLPSTYTLVLLCMALDVSADWLLGLDKIKLRELKDMEFKDILE